MIEAFYNLKTLPFKKDIAGENIFLSAAGKEMPQRLEIILSIIYDWLAETNPNPNPNPNSYLTQTPSMPFIATLPVFPESLMPWL